MLDLDELSRLHKAGTPGPWESVLLCDDSDRTYIHGAEFASARSFSIDELDGGLQAQIHADANLIVAAVNALPELIERVRKAGASLAEAMSWPPDGC